MSALIPVALAIALAVLARALPAATASVRARSLTDELGCYDRRFLDAQLRLMEA